MISLKARFLVRYQCSVLDVVIKQLQIGCDSAHHVASDWTVWLICLRATVYWRIPRLFLNHKNHRHAGAGYDRVPFSFFPVWCCFCRFSLFRWKFFAAHSRCFSLPASFSPVFSGCSIIVFSEMSTRLPPNLCRSCARLRHHRQPWRLRKACRSIDRQANHRNRRVSSRKLREL